MRKMLVCASDGNLTRSIDWFSKTNPLLLLESFDWCLRNENSNEKLLKKKCLWLRKPHKEFKPNIKRHSTESRAFFMNRANITRYMNLCDQPGMFYFYDDKDGDWLDFLRMKETMLNADGTCLLIRQPYRKLKAFVHREHFTLKELEFTVFWKDSKGNPCEKRLKEPYNKITLEDLDWEIRK